MKSYTALMEAELKGFLDARTTPDKAARVSATALYDAYTTWSEAGPSPVAPMTATMFGRLAPRLVIRRREATGQFYLGVRLVE
jgi:hypothetical protein